MKTLRLGTRGSQLALYQARTVAGLVTARTGTPCEVAVIRTTGDRVVDRALSDIGGKRLFVKEIEEALLDGDIDLAVHSSKDLPAVLPEGLEVGAVLPRANPADAIVAPGPAQSFATLAASLGPDTQVGTGSVRRVAQLRRTWPTVRFAPIRGNVDTRLRKLDEGEYDLIVLAAAGLDRLELASRITAVIPTDVCVPAPGQGIIAIEVRQDAADVTATLESLNDEDAATALAAEREVVAGLGGGCQMPIGAYCRPRGATIELEGLVASLDGARVVRHRLRGNRDAAQDLGRRMSERLLADGAGTLLAEAGLANDAGSS